MGLPILLPYQQRWLADRSPLKIWLASRQTGKSFTLALEAVVDALGKKSDNLLLSASERQSREIMRKVYSHLRYLGARSGEIIKAEREKSEEVGLENGSRIISLPASPDTVRGFSGNVFLDEFAFHFDGRSIWRAMYPSTTRGYKLRISSTPNGKQNMFYELWSGGHGFSRHKTNIYDAVQDGLAVDIDGLKRGAGDPAGWRQEFECEFIDGETALLPYELIAGCEEDQTEFGIPDFGSGSGELYLGVDIGRKRDLTVFWLMERTGAILRTLDVRVMRGETFRRQAEYLDALMHIGLPSHDGGLQYAIRRCCIDSTGIGMQLSEEAESRFGIRVEPVMFTNQIKERLAFGLRSEMEDRRVRIPADREIREDLHSVSRGFTAAGGASLDSGRTGDGSHADRFWALALAVHAARPCMGPGIAYERVAGRRAFDFNAASTGKGVSWQ